ncbi:armadillo-type protein [Mycena leptocephala]|nr:armadillo-type protein [Mycena leptocephala]
MGIASAFPGSSRLPLQRPKPLPYVLTVLTQEEDRIRTIAGYLLKNNARLVVNASPEVGAYVKAAVLHAFTDESPEKLMPKMANVAEYMLYSAKDKNENVALEACEFWLTFAEDEDLAMHLHPLLGKFAPVLLDCMVYGEDDLLWLEGNAEDAAIPDKDDKDTDIKPRHYGGGKSHGLERDANGNPAAPKTRIGVYCEEIASDEEDDYDLDDEDFADEMSTEWNLCKCAAAALGVLAVRFGGDFRHRFGRQQADASCVRSVSNAKAHQIRNDLLAEFKSTGHIAEGQWPVRAVAG